MPVFNGLQVHNSIRGSKLDAEASNFDLQKAINDVSLNTSLNYLNVILNKELFDNAQFQLESSTQQLERTKILVASGALPRANELQLESQVATNEVSLINAQNNLDLALLALKQSLLLPPGEEIDVEVPDIDVDQSEVEGSTIVEVYETAVTNQPEIKSADLRVESAKLALDVSKGGLYPTLNLSGGFSTNFSDAQVVFDQASGTFETVPFRTQYDNNLSQRLSLNLNIPVFNGFQARSQVQRSKVSVQQAELSSTEQRNALYQTIESSYRNALAASKTYTASQKQVESLEETYRAVENQYNNGAANFTDYQVAANNLFQAQSDLSRAKFDFIFRQKILDFYLGRPLTF